MTKKMSMNMKMHLKITFVERLILNCFHSDELPFATANSESKLPRHGEEAGRQEHETLGSIFTKTKLLKIPTL